MRSRALDQASRARTLGNEQRVDLSRVCPVFLLHFTQPHPNYARPSPSIMPGQTWRDNGHKALCPLSVWSARPYHRYRWYQVVVHSIQTATARSRGNEGVCYLVGWAPISCERKSRVREREERERETGRKGGRKGEKGAREGEVWTF